VFSEGKLYQESTFEIARLYNEAGLKLDESFRLPPDHIAVELECFAYLSFSEKEAIQAGNVKNEAYARELRRKMAVNYLGPLAFNVGQRIGEQARTDFFKVMGKLLTTLFPG
jgi:TorA maturation chaperone TorD